MSALVVAGIVLYALIGIVGYTADEVRTLRESARKGETYEIEPGWVLLAIVIWPLIAVAAIGDLYAWTIRRLARTEMLPEVQQRKVQELERALEDESA